MFYVFDYPENKHQLVYKDFVIKNCSLICIAIVIDWFDLGVNGCMFELTTHRSLWSCPSHIQSITKRWGSSPPRESSCTDHRAQVRIKYFHLYSDRMSIGF